MVKRLMLLILLMLFTTAAYAAQEDSFSAKLRIDNKVEMKWTVSDNDAVYVKIYGTDEGGENYVPVEERLPAADSGYMFDFIARGVDYSDFYTFVTLGADGGEITSKTVSTEFIMKRFGKQITNLQHPYMVATPELISAAKDKIKNYAFYRRSYEACVEMADHWVEYYKDFEGTIEQNPVANNGPMFDAKDAVFYCAEAYVLSDNPKQEWLDTSVKMMKALGDSYKVLPHLMKQIQDDFMITKMLCEGYDLIYEYISEQDRAQIEQDLFRTMAERVQDIPGRGILRGGVLNDLALVSIGLLLKDQELLEKGWRREEVYGFWSMMVNGVGDDGMWWEQSSGYHEGRIHHFGELGEEFINSGYDFYGNVFEGERNTVDRGGSMPRRRYKGAIGYARVKYMDLIDGLVNRVGLNGWIPHFGDATFELYLNSYGYVNYWERIYGRTGDEVSRYLLQLKYGTDRYESDPNSRSRLNDPKLIFVSNPDLGEKLDGIKFGNVQYNTHGYRKLGVSALGDMGEFAMRSRGTKDESTELFVQSCHYGTVSHSHGDKLSIILRIRGRQALADWGTYGYRTPARRQYSKFTAAHNTVLVDRRSQAPYENVNLTNGEFVGDDEGQFTGGEYNDMSIGPVSRAIMVSNNNCYSYAGVKMTRTLWQVDNYIFDVFDVDSNKTHTYDYGMNFDGVRQSINAYMTKRPDPDERLGDLVGAMMIKELSDGNAGDYAWNSVWKINSDDKYIGLKTTMLGESGTETNIISGLGVADDPELKVYDKNVMFASRNARKTTFAAVYDPDNNGAFRSVRQISCPDSDGEKVQGAQVVGYGKTDTYMTSLSDKMRSCAALKSDARSALLRSEDGEDTILGIMCGKNISGAQLSVSADRAVTFQLNKVSDGCYRLDMGENSEANISISGLEDCRLFKMALSDEIELSDDVKGNASGFFAEKNTIYVIARDGAEENMPKPYTFLIDVPKN